MYGWVYIQHNAALWSMRALASLMPRPFPKHGIVSSRYALRCHRSRHTHTHTHKCTAAAAVDDASRRAR
uniref:Secreted protein n=1 Tax=Trichogramma kaykai TaxID=54128 RepID=A0ABD2WXM7_9HYME